MSATSIQSAVEGLVDEAVVQRLIVEAGAAPGPVYGKRGKDHLRQRIHGFNNAARFTPWLVVVDLDREEVCAADLCASWLPRPASLMRFRVAVREVEAWLLADRERFARFLGVRRASLPVDPDVLDNPKGVVVRLAGTSSKRDIRDDLVPTPRGGRSEGPLYTSRLVEFALRLWRPAEASVASDSLHRCISRLAELVEEGP